MSRRRRKIAAERRRMTTVRLTDEELAVLRRLPHGGQAVVLRAAVVTAVRGIEAEGAMVVYERAVREAGRVG